MVYITTDRRRKSRKVPVDAFRGGLLALAVAALMLTAGRRVVEVFGRNEASLRLQRSLMGGSAPAEAEARLSADRPRAFAAYGLGLLAEARGDGAAAEEHWAEALRADVQYMRLVQVKAGGSASLAEAAVAAYPEEATAWEWLGDTESRPDAALEDYRRAVELNPRANLVWEKVASLARQQGNLVLSLEAARNACDLWPIRNGACHSAARLAFEAGDWETVIYYYERGFYPEHPEDWAEMIRAAQRLGREADAERLLAQAEQEYPADYGALLGALR